MHCKQISKQTNGEITEIELDGLRCNMAKVCRRKGICALSPFSCPGVVNGAEGQPAETVGAAPADICTSYYEVLRFKNSLGFQWMRVDSFAEAVLATESFREKGQPKIIRRMEFLQLPD